MAKRMEYGWKPLPLAFKIFFGFLLLETLSSLALLGDGAFFVFGFLLQGAPATALILLLKVAGAAVLLAGLWKRWSWAWKYAELYLLFFFVNEIANLATAYSSFHATFTLPSVAAALAMLAANAIFMAIFFRRRDYFERHQ